MSARHLRLLPAARADAPAPPAKPGAARQELVRRRILHFLATADPADGPFTPTLIAQGTEPALEVGSAAWRSWLGTVAIQCRWLARDGRIVRDGREWRGYWATTAPARG